MDRNILTCVQHLDIEEEAKSFISFRLQRLGVDNNFQPINDLCQALVSLVHNHRFDLPISEWDDFASFIATLNAPLTQGMVQSQRAGRGKDGLRVSAYPICALILHPLLNSQSLISSLGGYLVVKLICLTTVRNPSLSSESLNNIAEQIRLAFDTANDQHEVLVWLAGKVSLNENINDATFLKIVASPNKERFVQKQSICWKNISRLITAQLIKCNEIGNKANRRWLYKIREPTAYDWWAPTQLDLKILGIHVNQCNDSDNHYVAAKRLLLGLAMTIHMPMQDYEHLSISPEGPITPDGNYIKNIYVDDKESLFPPIRLQLPTPIKKIILRLCLKQKTFPVSLPDLLEIDPSKIRDIMKEGISEAFGTVHHRISPESLTHTLRHELALAHQDPALIYYLTGLPKELHPTLAHYLAYRSCDLQSHYQNITSKILGLDPPQINELANEEQVYFLGAGTEPDINKLEKQVSNLTKDFKRSLKSVGEKSTLSELYSAHNVLTSYVMLFLYYATGHRPIADPVESQHRIDLENGLLLVEDKVVSETHRYRVVPLPELLRKQLKSYINDLPVLYHLLSAQNVSKEVLNTIATVWLSYTKILITVDSDCSLFFLFDKDGTFSKVSNAQLSDCLPPYFEYGLFGGRRHLATYLYREGVCVPDISILLGHGATDLAAFGASSTLTPEATLKRLLTPMNKILEREGWSVLSMPALRKFRTPVIPTQLERTTEVQKESKRREEIRDKNMKLAVQAVDEILARYQPTDFTDNTVVLSVQSEIQQRLRHERLNILAGMEHYVRCLYRYVVGGIKISLPYALRWSNDPCPYDEDMVNLHAQAIKLRKDLLAAWKNEHAVKIINIRVAEICLAAALFGALIRRDCLEALPDSLIKHTWKINNNVLVDFFEEKDGKEVLTWRWWPDDISKALIMGLHKIKDISKLSATGISKTEVRREIRQLLQKHDPRTKLRGDVYSYLAILGEAYWMFHLPASLRAAASGQVSNTPLPLSVWIRILTPGQRLKPTDSDSSRKQSWHNLFFGKSEFGENQQAFSKFYDKLNKVFSEIENQPFTSDNADTVRRETLVQRIKEAFKNSNIPANGRYLLAWAIELALVGTRFQPIKFGSIHTYVPLVARQLRDYTPDEDLLFYDDTDFISLLDSIIDGNPNTSLSNTLGRMIEFLYFMKREFDAFIPNLSPYLRLGDTRSNVDANLITFREYHEALKIIYHDSRLSEERRILYALLLFLGYRLGTRISEALGLRHQELVYVDENLKHATLITNIAGRKKTSAGNRYSPLLDALTELEVKLLNRYQTDKVFAFRDDEQNFLFRSEFHTRKPISEQDALEHIHDVLRRVCGDPSIHFHSLRHAKANRDFLILHTQDKHQSRDNHDIHTLFPVMPDPNALKISLTGNATDKATTLAALARVIGHTRTAHTFANYLHTADWQVRQFIDSEELNDKHLEYFLYMTANTISHMRQERQISRKESHRVIDEYIGKSSIYAPETVPVPALNLDIEIKSRVRLSLVNIEKCLSLIAKNPMDMDRIIGTTGHNHDDLLNMIYTAAELERKIGFTFYKLGHLSRDLPYHQNQNPVPHISPAEDKRVIKKLVALQEKEVSKSSLINYHMTNMAHAFKHHYSEKQLLFIRPEKLCDCLKAMILLDLTPAEFNVFYQDLEGSKYSDWVHLELERELRHHKPKLIQVGSPIMPPTDPRPHLRLALIPRCGKGVSYPHTLYRLLFIICVYVEFNELLENRQE